MPGYGQTPRLACKQLSFVGQERMASQREIAERAGTSLKTVSRVINRDPLVNDTTRARIEAIIAEIGYEPHQAARMMRSQP